MDIVFFSDRPGPTADLVDTVTKTIKGQRLLGVPVTSGPAANDDRLDDARTQGGAVEATCAWDAYDVWRRCIKEARDRRKAQSESN